MPDACSSREAVCPRPPQPFACRCACKLSWPPGPRAARGSPALSHSAASCGSPAPSHRLRPVLVLEALIILHSKHSPPPPLSLPTESQRVRGGLCGRYRRKYGKRGAGVPPASTPRPSLSLPTENQIVRGGLCGQYRRKYGKRGAGVPLA